MQVFPLTLANLFEKNIRYVVPLYQRPYVWSEENQWQPLWDDIERLADMLLATGKASRLHFMGASVQDKLEVPPGHVETRRLIDGQQRFTTLQILLVAFRDAVRALDLPTLESALNKLVVNDHALRQSQDENHKVWPTNVDRSDFELVMTVHSPAALLAAIDAPAAKTDRPIVDAYFFFHGVIETWLSDGSATPEKKTTALYAALRDNIRIVVIDLDQYDDPQVIFETLNARGTPLLAADLVKNALLNEMGTDAAAVEQAYQRYWKPFDQEGAYWRRLVGRGHARRARIEHFFQHTLTILKREEVSAANLYTAYLDYARGTDAGTPQHRMQRIQEFSRTYRAMENREGSARFALMLERVQAMDIASITPLLMVLSTRLKQDKKALDAAATALESFLVRRLVCRLSTRGYSRFFVDLCGVAQAAEQNDIVPSIVGRLAQGGAEYDRWPSDEEFRHAWIDNPLYENLTRARLRIVVEALEMSLRTDLAETKSVPRNLTIEHVLPQSWQMHWPLPDNATASERNRRLHTIGNLTLVNDKLNPVLSNAPWTDLLDASGKLQLSGKRTTLGRHSTLFLNKGICEHLAWDDVAIAARSEALFAHAVKEWPRALP